MVTVAVALAAVAMLASGCSGLLDDDRADAVVEIEADDQAMVLRTRQEVLASATTWGGTRVAEETVEANETALEFTLPGENLEIALGAIGALDARVVSTTIDVDAEQIDRTTTPPADTDDDAEPAEPATVRLRVEVSEGTPGGAGALVQLVMGIFSIVGMVATVGWILNWWRRRGDSVRTGRAGTRNIDRVDLREDPPTQETPRVPPQW